MLTLMFIFVTAAALGVNASAPYTPNTPSTPNNYYGYIAVVNDQTQFVNKLRILQAITSEAILDYPRDWEKFATVYDQLGYLLNISANATEEEIKAANQLKQRITDYYTIEVAATVAEILRKDRYPHDEEVKYLLALCNTAGLAAENVNGVFEKSINECLSDSVAPHVLAAQLNFLSARLPLQIIWNAQIYLYWTWQGLGRNNDQYLFDVAYYTSQVKQDTYYNQLNSATQAQINQIISDLPSSLQHLFHKTDYCLLNNEYEEFLYTTNKVRIDDNNIYIFTWTDKYHVADNGPWMHKIRQLDFIATPELQLIFQLRSRLLKNYMYRTNIAQRTNLIVSRDDSTVPANSDFTYEFLSASNALLLRQDGHLVCAIPELYSSQRRYVLATDDKEHTPATKACQWKAQECYKTEANQ